MTQVIVGISAVALALIASLIAICIVYMHFEKTYSDVQFENHGDQLVLVSVRIGFTLVVALWFVMTMATLVLSMDALAIYYW